jgi:hypothetical protein
MSRKSVVQLIAQAAVDFPDNNASLITPAVLRGFLVDLLTTFSPAYSWLRNIGPATQTFGLTSTIVQMTSAFNSDPSQALAATPTNSLTRVERGTSVLHFAADIESANNRFVTFTLFKNGVATPWSITANGLSAGNPVNVAMNAVDYDAAPGSIYTVRAVAEANGQSVTMTNMTMLLLIAPTRDFT